MGLTNIVVSMSLSSCTDSLVSSVLSHYRDLDCEGTDGNGPDSDDDKQVEADVDGEASDDEEEMDKEDEVNKEKETEKEKEEKEEREGEGEVEGEGEEDREPPPLAGAADTEKKTSGEAKKKKKGKGKRKWQMPKRENYSNYLDYMEAKYSGGVPYNSSDDSSSNDGSVYEEMDCVDDSELRRALEDDVVGGAKADVSGGEDGFFATAGSVELIGEDEVVKGLISAKEAVSEAKANAKRAKNNAINGANDDEKDYLSIYEAAKVDLREKEEAVKEAIEKYDVSTREAEAQTETLTIKFRVPSIMKPNRIVRINHPLMPKGSNEKVKIPTHLKAGDEHILRIGEGSLLGGGMPAWVYFFC